MIVSCFIFVVVITVILYTTSAPFVNSDMYLYYLIDEKAKRDITLRQQVMLRFTIVSH